MFFYFFISFLIPIISSIYTEETCQLDDFTFNHISTIHCGKNINHMKEKKYSREMVSTSNICEVTCLKGFFPLMTKTNTCELSTNYFEYSFFICHSLKHYYLHKSCFLPDEDEMDKKKIKNYFDPKRNINLSPGTFISNREMFIFYCKDNSFNNNDQKVLCFDGRFIGDFSCECIKDYMPINGICEPSSLHLCKLPNFNSANIYSLLCGDNFEDIYLFQLNEKIEGNVVCRVECKPGYLPLLTKINQCIQDDTWKVKMICYKKEDNHEGICLLPTMINLVTNNVEKIIYENKDIDISPNTFIENGHSFEYECVKNAYMVGNRYIRCLNNLLIGEMKCSCDPGYVSDNGVCIIDNSCKIPDLSKRNIEFVICGKNMENLYDEYSSLTHIKHNYYCVMQCKVGYRNYMFSSTKCLNDKKWSNDFECESKSMYESFGLCELPNTAQLKHAKIKDIIYEKNHSILTPGAFIENNYRFFYKCIKNAQITGSVFINCKDSILLDDFECECKDGFKYIHYECQEI